MPAATFTLADGSRRWTSVRKRGPSRPHDVDVPRDPEPVRDPGVPAIDPSSGGGDQATDHDVALDLRALVSPHSISGQAEPVGVQRCSTIGASSATMSISPTVTNRAWT